MRKRGLADAEKRTGRETSEGYIGMKLDKQNKLITMIELHCETDFVAKTDRFKEGVERLVETFHKQGPSFQFSAADSSNADKITHLIKTLNLDSPLDHDLKQQNIEDGIKFIISKTQENCKLARVYQRSWNSDSGEVLHGYVHNPDTVNNVLIGKIATSIVSYISRLT